MDAQFCNFRLEGLAQLVRHYRPFTSTLCVLNLLFSSLAILGNLLVIRALWKASSIPANLKKLFLSLAFLDLAVGLFVQLMYGIIMAVMLKIAANGNYNSAFLCPTILSVCYFSMFSLACASFFTITFIAVDRLLAVSLHLRYQELVTSRRVAITLVSLLLTSGVAAFIFISRSNHSSVVTAVVACLGFLLTTVAYIRVYKVVRYHKNQIQSQLQQVNNQEMQEQLRERKAAFNILFVYVIFVACYLPHTCVVMWSVIFSSQISFFFPSYATLFLVLLNSSLNPLVYCWRFREIRQSVKSTVIKIFHIQTT